MYQKLLILCSNNLSNKQNIVPIKQCNHKTTWIPTTVRQKVKLWPPQQCNKVLHKNISPVKNCQILYVRRTAPSKIIIVKVLLRQTTLTRGSGRFIAPDSALVLQYGSGPSSDFLAKILDINTPLFLLNTQFHFLGFHYYFKCLIKEGTLMLFKTAQLIACLPMVRATQIWFPMSFPFLITMSIMALEAIKFNLLFKSLHLFIFYLPLFAYENKRSSAGFSICYDQNSITT
jgi:hypothetical protein